MKKIFKHNKLKNPVYEHLDVFMQNTYAQRLAWLEEAWKFVDYLNKKKKIKA